MNAALSYINDYNFKQRSWCDSYNEIYNKNIEDTLEELKTCAADLSYDVLYYAMKQFAHIDHVKYILSVLGDQPSDMHLEIQDIIQWMYICCEYNIGLIHECNTVLYKHYLWLLDQYAALFSVTYSKSHILEKMATNCDRNATWKLYILLELDSIGYTMIPQIKRCIASGAVLDRGTLNNIGESNYHDIPLWEAIDIKCSIEVFKILFDAHYNANEYNKIYCDIPLGDGDNDNDYEYRYMTLRGYIQYMMGVHHGIQRSSNLLKQYWRIISPHTKPKAKKDRSTMWYL